jgi:hypothetical protein
MNITQKEVEELDGALNSKLLSGLTTMGWFKGGGDSELLLTLLQGIESKIPSFNVRDIRRTIWSVSKMRREVGGVKGEKVAAVCREILMKLADETRTMCGNLPAADIRIILQSFVMMGFRCDEMVEAMETEVTRRLGILGQGNNEVLGETECLGILRKEEGKGVEEVRKRMERMEGGGGGVRIERILEDSEDSSSFELGRCKELIASYRRLEFGEEHKNDIFGARTPIQQRFQKKRG